MSKQIRNIVITVAVVILLLGGLLALKLIPAQPSEDNETTTTTAAAQTTQPGESAPALEEPIDDGIYLTQDEEGNLDYIEIENEYGKYTLRQPQKNMWMVEGYDDLLISDAVGYIVDSCANFKLASVVTEDCKDFSEYGLTSPTASARIVFRDGSEMTVCFGDVDPASVTKSRYVYVKGGKTVYLESVGLSTAFTRSLEYMFSTEVLSPQRTTDADDKIAFSEIASVELGGTAREQVIKIEKNKYFERGNIGNDVLTGSKLLVTSPISAPLDTDTGSTQFGAAYSRILETGIEAASVEKVHPSESDLEKYGLTADAAYTLKITSEDGKVFRFLAGECDPASGAYYLTDEFGKMIFSIDENHGLWLSATLGQLVPKKLYESNCLKLSKVTVKTQEGTNVFDITQLQDAQISVKNGSREIEPSTFRSFFDSLCKLEWIDTAQKIPTIGGKDTVLEVRVNYAGASGATADVITLTKCSPRRYLIAINGKGYFACDTTALETVLSAYRAML